MKYFQQLLIPMCLCACMVASIAASGAQSIVIPSTDNGGTAYGGDAGICIGCDVLDVDNMVTPAETDYASATMPVGVLGTTYAGVTFGSEQAAGRYAGFVIREPIDLLDVEILDLTTISTYLDGELQEVVGGLDLLLINLLDDPDHYAVQFVTEDPFDELVMTKSGLASVLYEYHVYHAFSSEEFIPVELSSFDAVLNGRSASLSWTTESETNNAGFEVQHSIEGRAFASVGFVTGAGTTTEAHNYTYDVDNLSVGTHTFRLKQIDFDGGFAYSYEVEVSVDELVSTHELSAPYPNPFNPTSTFTLSVSTDQHVTATLRDVLGREVANLFDGSVSSGEQMTVQVNGSGLSSGSYLVHVQGEHFLDVRQVSLIK